MGDAKRVKSSYYSEEYRTKQLQKVDRNFGPITEHTKKCERCKSEYIFTGRQNTKTFQKSRFCSRSCANHRGSGVEWEQTIKTRSLVNYRTICFSHWKVECVRCGYDKIVGVHHIDENHYNNDKQNLIPLCNNCHAELHSNKYGAQVKAVVEQRWNEKWGIS